MTHTNAGEINTMKSLFKSQRNSTAEVINNANTSKETVVNTLLKEPLVLEASTRAH